MSDNSTSKIDPTQGKLNVTDMLKQEKISFLGGQANIMLSTDQQQSSSNKRQQVSPDKMVKLLQTKNNLLIGQFGGDDEEPQD